jgi:hypothetical protein
VGKAPKNDMTLDGTTDMRLATTQPVKSERLSLKVIGTTVIIRVAIETGMRKVREIVGMDADTYDPCPPA